MKFSVQTDNVQLKLMKFLKMKYRLDIFANFYFLKKILKTEHSRDNLQLNL